MVHARVDYQMPELHHYTEDELEGLGHIYCYQALQNFFSNGSARLESEGKATFVTIEQGSFEAFAATLIALIEAQAN